MGDSVRNDLCGMTAWEEGVGGYTDGDSLSCEAVPAPASGAAAATPGGGVTPGMTHPGDGVDGPDFAPYAEASVDPDGDMRAGAALLRGTDPRTGISAMLIGGSIEAGSGQVTVNAGMADISAGRPGSNGGRVTVFGADGSVGMHNADGSEGFNAGAGVTIASAEGTVHPFGGGVSVTGGLSAGVSASGSVGIRDADADGRPEACGRASILAFTGGVCVERPW